MPSNERSGNMKGLLFATLLLCASVQTSTGFSSFSHPTVFTRDSSPIMSSSPGQQKLSHIQNRGMKFELSSHPDVEDMGSCQFHENKGEGLFKQRFASISKEKVTKNVKVITKCLALSLMLCSFRPNLSVAKAFSKSVSPETSLASAKRTGMIVRTVLIGGLVAGVGAIQILRQQKDFSFKVLLEQQKERFDALMSIVKSKPDATTDDWTSQEEEAAAKKVQEDAELAAAARIQEEKDRLAMEAEAAKKDIEEALRKQKEEEEKIKKNLELEAKKADLVKKMVAEAEERAKEVRLKEEEEAKKRALEGEKAIEAAKIKEENEAKMKTLSEEKAKMEAMEQQMAKEKEEMMNPLRQPKTPNVENLLATKYNSIQDLEEKAFTILADLKMIQKTPDPNDPDYDNSKDEEIASENIFLKYSNKKD